ncbi:hypothetical protein AO398_13300 [Methylobacterium sp. GXS13]|nr:hypothetical protein AO398_13300 [Methylobacterium sp. GXS13]
MVVPVTVDRSISEFLLGQLAAHPEERFSAVRARAVFESAYPGEFRQIAQRPAEQTASATSVSMTTATSSPRKATPL